jgi:phenylacetate-coenzyme A ligase PaaK-like adenylate-forming protein
LDHLLWVGCSWAEHAQLRSWLHFSPLEAIEQEDIKKQILVSGKVEIVNYGALPRSERKSKRVFDNREV